MKEYRRKERVREEKDKRNHKKQADIFLTFFLDISINKDESRRRNEEKKAERQKAIEAKRAAKKGPMKLGTKKVMID